ncbi:DedA family protein [Rhizorhabdus dicambivorans]|uniref:DedA family protein n=1 Tax=Rhizorhabdus dicambivorans TaxID=1850238 RepID=A0A2A4FZ16_9SPHN|nr:DedA family protein [Rhizorhabdus dicambivorans]ATE67079.1 DedA family protein [Rhizorhabdus dicambivorans]PCE43702.1 DedA family protein [Rhizorhabdus dicambivorans]
MDIGQLVTAIGPWAIALGAGFEGETAAVAGGVMANHGLFPAWAAFLATAFGAFFADQLFFQIGRRFRDRPFVVHARQKPVFARAVGFIERWPTGFIFAYRFLYGFRVVSPIAIGLSHIPLRRFAALNGLACLLWSAVFTTLGYLFGPAVDRALKAMAPYKTEILIALPVPGTCLLIWWLWRKHRQRRRERLNPPFHAPEIQ